MISETELYDYVDRFIVYMKNTREYKEYIHALRELEKYPDIKEKVYEFRRENYFLQHAPEHEDIYERVAELRSRNEELLERPEVSDFLMTEWEFFGMMQGVFDRIMNNMDF